MRIEEFIERLAAQNRCAPGTHIIAEPLSSEEYEQWQARHPTTPLPSQFVQLLKRANGIKFHTIGSDGYFELLPLDRLTTARHMLYGKLGDSPRMAEDYPDSALGISSHLDGTNFAAIDTRSGVYLDADAVAGPSIIGGSIDTFLDWAWANWVAFRLLDV